jgi:hypothetical protein
MLYNGTMLIVFTDDSKSTVCFVCRKPDRLLSCLYCPRSYHPGCLDPTLCGFTQAEGWVCPACSILHAHEPTAPMTTRQLPQPPKLSNSRSSGGDASFVEAPESTIFVDSARPEEMSGRNASDGWPQDSSTQPTYSLDPKSLNPSSIPTQSNLQEGMSNESPAPNQQLRGKLPGLSSVEPRIFIHAHSAMPHHHSNAASKLG